MNAAITKFVTAIGYPLEEIKWTEGPVSLLVDELTIEVREIHGGLILSYALGHSDEIDFMQVASFATGRILKEEAVVAYEPERGEMILWQKVPANLNVNMLKTVFELFMTSCEWWKTAIDSLSSPKGLRQGGTVQSNEMRIMP